MRPGPFTQAAAPSFEGVAGTVPASSDGGRVTSVMPLHRWTRVDEAGCRRRAEDVRRVREVLLEASRRKTGAR